MKYNLGGSITHINKKWKRAIICYENHNSSLIILIDQASITTNKFFFQQPRPRINFTKNPSAISKLSSTIIGATVSGWINFCSAANKSWPAEPTVTCFGSFACCELLATVYMYIYIYIYIFELSFFAGNIVIWKEGLE